MPPALEQWFETRDHLLPSLAVMAAVASLAVVALIVLDSWLKGREEENKTTSFRRRLMMVGATLVAALLVAIASPAPEWALKAVGIIASVVLTLSSSTLVANGLAGVMLQGQRHFRPGDYLRVRDDFGKVSRQGLFFTQLETDLADLVTLPNSYLANNPVTVIRGKRTLISAELSLGYDVDHRLVAQLLEKAVAAAKLDPEKSFVHILELGDFAVQYRVSAELTDLKRLLTQQSQLKEAILDTLHGAGVEIASPSIMMQRPTPADHAIMPEANASHADARLPQAEAELLMFQRSLDSETAERLTDLLNEKRAQLAELRRQDGAEDSAAARLAHQCELIESKISQLKEKAASRR